MRKFTDNIGREWSLNITLGTIERVREATGVNLSKLFEDNFKVLEDLFGDPLQLATVVLAVLHISPTAEQKADFFDSISDESLEAAANALADAVIDFFPNPKRREALREMFRKAWAAVDAATSKAIEAVSQIDPTALLTAGNSPVSSALTPAT